MEKLILASNSPRRRELLKKIRKNFTVLPSNVKETVDPALTPEEVAMSLAREKAENVYSRFGGTVIGADTVVVLDGVVLGKPRNKAEALGMLTSLSGRTHRVITGLAVLSQGARFVEAEITEVTFEDLSEDLIRRYVASGLPFDKAGGYGIQDGYPLVREYRGSYDNIVGLPVERLARILKEVG